MRLYKSSASFTRPANAIAYSGTDLVANDTVAANVVPMTFSGLPQGFLLTGVKINDNNAQNQASAIFNVILYQYPPVSNVGDNTFYAVTGEFGWLGATSVDCTANYTNGFPSAGTFFDGFTQVDPLTIPIFFDDTPGITGNQVYGFLMMNTGNTYTPTSHEVFTVTLIGVD